MLARADDQFGTPGRLRGRGAQLQQHALDRPPGRGTHVGTAHEKKQPVAKSDEALGGIGRQYRGEPTARLQKPYRRIAQLGERKPHRMACRGAPCIGTRERIDEKRRIGDDQIEPLLRLELLHGRAHHPQPCGPRRRSGIGASLVDRLHVDARHPSLRGPLGQHQGDEPRTGADVEQAPVRCFDRDPGPEQHTVGPDLHRGEVLPDVELLETENGHAAAKNQESNMACRVDPDPEQGEIEPHGVAGIESAEHGRNLLHCAPVVLPSDQQPQRTPRLAGVEIQGQVERRHGDAAPLAEIDAPVVVPHHPAQKHAKTLAGRPLVDRREVFLATRRMVASEKLAPEIGQRLRQRPRNLVTALEESAEAPELRAETSQRQDEIAQIAAVERTVRITVERGQLTVRRVAHEVGRRIVHDPHHAVAAAHDRLAVAPGDGGSQETSHLAVGAVGEAVRHRDGIGLDEFGAVVAVVQPLQQVAQRIVHGVRESCRPT